MVDLISKLSNYDLFNNLFPGVIFAVISEKITSYSFLQKDIVISLFVYYFIGLVISRFGSLVIERVLKKIKFLKFVNYEDFVSASKNDPNVALLSETNNTYRAISSMFALLLILKICELIVNVCPILKEIGTYLVIFILFILFLLSYRKQTECVVKRVNLRKGD